MTETILYLVRHGEAEGNIVRNFHGWYDSMLTENGKKQVETLKTWFSGKKVDAVYASDLRRASDTAKVIAALYDLPVYEDEALREIYGGEWEDVPWDDLPTRFPESYGNWLKRPHLLEMPGGETMPAFQDRIYDALQKIAEENQGRYVAAATHGTAIKVFLCRVRNIPLSRMPEESWCDNASVTVLSYKNGKFTVLIDGDNSHLGSLSTLAKQDWWRKE